MTKQAGNTSADREAELRKRLADDAGSFGCPADIADLFAMLDEARAQLDEDAEQDAQIEEDAVAEHEHDLEVAYWANQVRDACDVLRPGRFGRGEPGEDPPIVTMAKAVVAERDEATKRAEAAERDLADARSQLAALHAEVAREVRGMPCGHVNCGCTKHTLMRVLADLATAAREHEQSIRSDERVKALREARDLARTHATGNREAGEAWRGYAMAQDAIARHLDKLADEAEVSR